MEKLKEYDHDERLEHAFDVANREYGVPRLIESKGISQLLALCCTEQFQDVVIFVITIYLPQYFLVHP